MHLPDENAVPKLKDLSGIESLDLQPEEAFVLSRVDGQSSLKQIAQILGYDVPRVLEFLSRLVEVDLVEFPLAAQAEKPKKGPKSAEVDPAIVQQLDREDLDPVLQKISRKRRQEILLFHQNIDRKNYYELFTIARRSRKEDVKRAYFRLVKKFHPDRFFGLELGDYRERIDQAFAHVTTAYEVLLDPVLREGYDQELKTSSRQGQDPDGSKLQGNSGPSKATTSKTGRKGGGERAKSALRYLEMGEKEEIAGDMDKAAAFFQLAMEHDPENPSVANAYQRGKPFLDRRRGDEAFRRGSTAMERGDEDAAIRYFEETLKLNPRKKECYRELAVLYLHRKRDLGRAKELGLQAVEFLAKDAQVHSVMGEIYRSLGDAKAARREFKASLKLDKDNGLALFGLEQLDRRA